MPHDATPFYLEVTGEEGKLLLERGAIRGFQSGRLRLVLKGGAQSVDEGEMAFMPDTTTNVAGMYAALRDDILNDASTVPDFDHAARLSQLIESVCASGEKGNHEPASRWPVR